MGLVGWRKGFVRANHVPSSLRLSSIILPLVPTNGHAPGDAGTIAMTISVARSSLVMLLAVL